VAELEPMRDHWWWRPGWKAGRSFYTWHVTFADQASVQQLVSDYTPVLTSLPMLDPVPVRWLHLTTQGIGFTDEVPASDVDQIVQAVQQRCAPMTPFTVVLGPADVDPEALFLPVQPIAPLAEVRRAIRDGIGDVWGPDRVPEPPDGFHPHVSLGYSNTAGPAEPVAEALTAHSQHTAEVTVTSVSLIELDRDNKVYEWTDTATVTFDHG
jgi:2'-5' RNA ligase